jgi:hypothetical protein
MREISQPEAKAFKAKSIARGRLLERFRCHVQEVVEHAEDEGDRVYFGTSNHFEYLKEIADEMDMWGWDAVIRERDEVDPYADLRKVRDENRSLSSELDRLREENASLRSGLSLQPISTADKDAERLTLGIVRNGVLEELHIGGFRYAINDDEVSCWWSVQCDDEIVPTHWMPAPLSPDNSTQKKEG